MNYEISQMSDCKAIAICNRRGGGKVTTAVNLGIGLAKNDKKVRPPFPEKNFQIVEETIQDAPEPHRQVFPRGDARAEDRGHNCEGLGDVPQEEKGDGAMRMGPPQNWRSCGERSKAAHQSANR